MVIGGTGVIDGVANAFKSFKKFWIPLARLMKSKYVER
jgi:hypothetical protein